MLESKFQSHLIKRLKEEFDGCIVLKNDATYLQGIPDLLILYGNKWAALEVKRSAAASVQPNQSYYIDRMNAMAYAAFVSPETEEMIFHELQQALKSDW